MCVCSQCYEGVVDVISTLSMVLKAISAWKQHQALPVPTNVFSVGGRSLTSVVSSLFISHLCWKCWLAEISYLIEFEFFKWLMFEVPVQLSACKTCCQKVLFLMTQFWRRWLAKERRLDLFLLWKRHHTNPVGTEWKWKMDSPQTILDGALANHLNLIRQFRGTCIFPKIMY